MPGDCPVVYVCVYSMESLLETFSEVKRLFLDVRNAQRELDVTEADRLVLLRHFCSF